MLLHGVRNGSIARMGEGENTGTERKMTVSFRDAFQLISDPKNLDESVNEVFGMMLGAECQRTQESAKKEDESVTAVVGFGGALSGACVFACAHTSAISIATLMTGMEFSEIDDTVKDGMGEICNMLAGAWKGKVPGLSANCGLSVPAVITGRDYNLHVQAPEFQLRQNYLVNQESIFEVVIICDGLQ
jgi:chemotaxis protein CheX